MNKKQSLNLAIILTTIAIIIFYRGDSLFSTVGLVDDYLFFPLDVSYEDWPAYQEKSGSWILRGPPGELNPLGNPVNTDYFGYDYSKNQIWYKYRGATWETKILGGIDFEVLLSNAGQASVVTTKGSVTGLTIGVCRDDPQPGSPGESVISVIVDRIDSNKAAVYYQGIFKGEIDITDGYYLSLYSCDQTYLLKAIPKYRIPFETSCGFGPNDLLASQTFAGGSSFNIVDFYSSQYPIKKLCAGLPTIITRPTGTDSDTFNTVYQQLVSGAQVVVPNDQTYTIFYVFDNSDGLVSTACDVEQDVFNINEGQCVPRGGIVNVCSQGQLSEKNGVISCVVENQPVCNLGVLLQDDNGNYYCKYTPPLEQICERGTLDVTTGTCLAPLSLVCPEGSTKLTNSDGSLSCISYIEQTVEIISGECPAGTYVYERKPESIVCKKDITQVTSEELLIVQNGQTTSIKPEIVSYGISNGLIMGIIILIIINLLLLFIRLRKHG